jgi:uncharacterized protein YjbI with pentapeptide repeats
MSDSSYRIITLGVPAGNQWRQSHPDVKPNLDAARLARADLSGCDLDNVVLFEADLEGTNLARAQLRGAVLQGDCLRDADLTRANLANADLGGTFDRDRQVPLAFPQGADLRNALLYETLFVNTRSYPSRAGGYARPHQPSIFTHVRSPSHGRPQKTFAAIRAVTAIHLCGGRSPPHGNDWKRWACRLQSPRSTSSLSATRQRGCSNTSSAVDPKRRVP